MLAKDIHVTNQVKKIKQFVGQFSPIYAYLAYSSLYLLSDSMNNVEKTMTLGQ
jgi:hypothetical protein